jgi:hypothetical protein
MRADHVAGRAQLTWDTPKGEPDEASGSPAVWGDDEPQAFEPVSVRPFFENRQLTGHAVAGKDVEQHRRSCGESVRRLGRALPVRVLRGVRVRQAD